jgi:ubiquinone/menaquinone biosynthesis C-methylase UbiE
MGTLILVVGRFFICVIIGFFMAHSLIRIIRYFVKFPIPSFLVRMIDNPFRRKIQPPAKLVDRLEVQQGMHMLEVGPGSGTYTRAFSEAIGEGGFIAALDIELPVLVDLKRCLHEYELSNVFPLVGDVHHPPFADHTFDAIYMITVIGEIPRADEAVKSFYRIIEPGGMLMFSEVLLDPDFPLPRTLRSWAQSAGFDFHAYEGNLLSYTITFQRQE